MVDPISCSPKNPRKRIDRTGEAFEKLRRAAVKVTDTSWLQGSETQEASRLFLVSAVDALDDVPIIVKSSVRNLIFNYIYTVQKMDSDSQGQALDTIFTLAHTTIVAQDPRTYHSAFEFLMRATRLYESGVLQMEMQANFARFTSHVFYNLAGVLYQHSRWAQQCDFSEKLALMAVGRWRSCRPPSQQRT